MRKASFESHVQATTKPDAVEGGEDFRTTLQNAVSCVQDLESFARSESMAPTALSAKSNNQFTDLGSQRIEVMGKLIDILRRSMRVRYELNFIEVLHA